MRLFKTPSLLASSWWVGLFVSSLPLISAATEQEIAGKVTVTSRLNHSIAGPDAADLSRLAGDDSFDLSGLVQLSYHLSGDDWGIFSHLQLTDEADNGTGNIGVVELYGYQAFTLDQNQSVTLTLGQLFMASSFENSETFWDSPYSNNFSALNSWIAQEVRPVGVEFKYDWISDESDPFSAFGLTAMAFVDNDSMGSQLTWRGWSFGHHKSVYGEVLKLPQISQIEYGMFKDQRDDGSKPFGRDLDQRIGAIFSGYWSPNRAVQFKFSYLDNNGDGKIYRGEYAWDTKFAIVGGQWQINEQWTVLSEWMKGSSAMGAPPIVGVDVDFQTQYLLANYHHQQWDHSIRVEWFDAVDTVSIPKESNDNGRALTLATRWQAFGKPWSVIGELLWVDATGTRTRALDNGLFKDENESQLSVAVHYFF